MISSEPSCVGFLTPHPLTRGAGGATLSVSAVNLAEVYGVLVGRGEFDSASVEGGLTLLRQLIEVIPFGPSHIAVSGLLLARSKREKLNLSLGDCACLATAALLGVSAATADQAWGALPNLGVPVELVR